jgi:PLP dependent protein
MMEIAQRIQQVRGRIARAAQRVRRDPSAVVLMAVTKTVSPERITQAYDAGLRVFGENRVQEFEDKHAALKHLSNAQLVLIGHLQSNKANKAASLFDAVHSVDSLRILERLNAAREKLQLGPLPVLIEINVGGEEAKSGLPCKFEAVAETLRAAPQLVQVKIGGLMTIPPHTEDPEDARSYFRKLRELRDEIAGRNLPGVTMDELSMGMSHDFEIAVEEGSTCVRIGTAIFGERPAT